MYSKLTQRTRNEKHPNYRPKKASQHKHICPIIEIRYCHIHNNSHHSSQPRTKQRP